MCLLLPLVVPDGVPGGVVVLVSVPGGVVVPVPGGVVVPVPGGVVVPVRGGVVVRVVLPHPLQEVGAASSQGPRRLAQLADP